MQAKQRMFHREYFLFVFSLQVLLCFVCVKGFCESDCGFNSDCTHGVCKCKSGHSSNENGTNCVDDLCGDGQCYECHDKNRCRRCKVIVVEGSGKCVTSCSTATTLRLSGEYTGKVCQAEDETTLKVEYIVLIASFSGVFVLVVVVAVAIYAHKLTDRNSDGDLPASPTNGSIAMTHQLLKSDRPAVLQSAEDIINIERRVKVRRMTSFRAMVYSPSQKTMKDGREENRQLFFKKLSSLKSDAETFLEMLNDLRRRLQLLQENQTPAPQYRSMIQDLSRILFLLNRNGEDFEIPPDGTLLLDWGEYVLSAYQEHNAAMNAKLLHYSLPALGKCVITKHTSLWHAFRVFQATDSTSTSISTPTPPPSDTTL